MFIKAKINNVLKQIKLWLKHKVYEWGKWSGMLCMSVKTIRDVVKVFKVDNWQERL